MKQLPITRLFPKKKNHRVALAIFVIMLTTGGAVMAPACAAMGNTPSKDAIEVLKSSKNYNGKTFVNSLPAKDPSMLKAFKEWRHRSAHATPESAVPVHALSASDFHTQPKSGLRITWLGHSTSLIEIDGARFLFDPVWSMRSSPFSWAGPKRFFDTPISISDLPPIDGVLISHDHYDHLDKSTIQQLNERDIRFIVPLGVDARLHSFGVAKDRIEALDWWQRTKINNVTITVTPARHFSGRSMSDRNKTLWGGFALKGPAHSVYYTGDTGMFPGFTDIGKRLGPFDATLVEIGAYHRLWADLHLGPEQAVQAVQNAQGGLLIPVHWATFNLAMHGWTEPAERLIEAAKKADQAVVFPLPGQPLEPSAPPTVEKWWPPLPWQTAQEHPVVSSGMSPSM
ncbi:MAG: MBL fold metallo-hydrolase [Deltaproteobacteria bacterium]|nr:MBL fold metallo-hydrolase [Deltaproteobacteria bacterium]MBN2674802.1 MBL fold metallo-hydrolase [Deltaproteobacteria bacterium]